MSLLHFEDFSPGDVAEYDGWDMTAPEMIAFAQQFDPQPFHLDEEAGRGSMAGGLIASGWHTAVMLMRTNVDRFIRGTATAGGLGVDEINWLQPVRPGDHLMVRSTIVSARASKSRPEFGIVQFGFEVLNNAQVVVMTLKLTGLIRRRASEESAA
jgi:acyl dehydratase